MRPYLARAIRALCMLAIVTGAFCAIAPAVAAAPAHSVAKRQVSAQTQATDSNCIDIQYNGNTYESGTTVPPFPKNITFAIYADWSDCVFAQFNPFTVEARIYTAQGGTVVAKANYVCVVAAALCDVTHTFSFNTSQSITWFTVSFYDDTNSDTTDPLYEADYSVDPGTCIHAFVDDDSRYLRFSYTQGSESGLALATLWQLYALTPQNTYTPCHRYYAKVTYQSYGGLPGKSAIWLYDDATHAYLASAPTPYIGADSQAISGYTNTVNANGVDIKLGVAAPNSNSAYVMSSTFYG